MIDHKTCEHTFVKLAVRLAGRKDEIGGWGVSPKGPPTGQSLRSAGQCATYRA